MPFDVVLCVLNSLGDGLSTNSCSSNGLSYGFTCSPRSGTSSNASTPSTKKLDGDKPTTPISKSVTPTSGGSGSSAAGGSGLKPVVKAPPISQYPHYIGAGAGPHDPQAAAAAAAAGYGPLHNNLPPALNSVSYPRTPLVTLGNYDPHSQMRAPPLGPASLGGIPGGKP